MRCVIVDDDDFSRKTLRLLCDKIEYVKIIEEFSTPIDAMRAMHYRDDVDVFFLDIHMPEISGFDFIESLKNPPKIIFTTSDPGQALEAFEAEATDYLVKPIKLKRLLKALNKVRDSRPQTAPIKQGDHKGAPQELFITVNKSIVRVKIKDLCIIEAKGDYALLYMQGGEKHIVRTTIKNISVKLPNALFVKVHRSYIVNMSKIVNIEDGSLLINKKLIPISRRHWSTVQSRLNML